MADEEEQPDRTVTVTISFDIPEGMPIIFCNHSAISHTTTEFYLAFFQSPPPRIAEGQKVDDGVPLQISAKCIAQLMLTPEAMERFVAAASTNLARFKKRKPERSESES